MYAAVVRNFVGELQGSGGMAGVYVLCELCYGVAEIEIGGLCCRDA